MIDYIFIKPINSFAKGLLSFFDFLNYKTNKPQKIVINSKDEFELMANLLSNAIKFSPYGSKITIIIEDDTLNNLEAVKISVKDEGIGIKSGSEKYIFNRFTQIKSNYQSGGTGLGLAICKEIINAHNGKIYAQNNSDKGALFIFLIHKKECAKLVNEKNFDINLVL